MKSKRIVILAGVLLALFLGYLAQPWYAHYIYSWMYLPKQAAPLAGINEVKNVQVKMRPDGQWGLSFDYFFTGSLDGAQLVLFYGVDRPAHVTGFVPVVLWAAERGKHHVDIVLPYSSEAGRVARRVDVAIRAGEFIGASAGVREDIHWPEPQVAKIQRTLAKNSPEDAVRLAVEFIDEGTSQSLEHAKQLLQALVTRKPDTDAAYVELARVAMKTNWSPDGLRESEALIRSALQIRPDSVNAKILLGYVHTHQGRLKEAEQLFVQAAAVAPPVPNMWLWSNWGDLRVRQGQRDEAIAKYRQAVAGKPTGDTYDRAREFAYARLLELLEAKENYDLADTVYRQRIADYPDNTCSRVAHARFLALKRGDTAAAGELLKTAGRCTRDYVQPVEGLVLYVNWFNSGEPGRIELLHQARAILPLSPRLMYELAGADRSAEVLGKLVTTGGEKVDLKDGQEFNALAYALSARDAAAARRLLKLGARPDTLVGPQQMAVAVLPVLTRDYEGIRLMRRAGVDYARVQFEGASVLQQAQRAGDPQLMRALAPESGKL